MAYQAETVARWLNAIKTEAGQKSFLQHEIQHAIGLVRTIRNELLNEADVQLVRLLRNCVPLGEDAVDAILQGGVVTALARTLSSVPASALSPNGSFAAAVTHASAAASGSDPAGLGVDGVGTAFRAACSQLLANLASAGPTSAAEVWAHCFPGVFLGLLAHSSGQVHKPATLALYSCCRQSLRCSLALCAAAAVAPSDAHTDNGGPAAPPGHSGGSDSAEGGCGVAATDAREIWEVILGRLTTASAPGPHGEARGSGGGGGPDWTALLCGCVALRQGLLCPLLMLLLAPRPSALRSKGAAGSGAGVAATGAAGEATRAAAAVDSAASAQELRGVCGDSDAAVPPPLRFGALWPVLLHVLAHEVYELQGGGAVDLSGWVPYSLGPGCGHTTSKERGPEAAEDNEGPAKSSGRSAAAALAALPPAAQPVAAALLHITELVEAAARYLAAAEDDGGGGGGGGGDSGEVQGMGSCSSGGGEAALAAAVLEAGLEVVKSVTQREDGGRAFSGGADLVEWLLCDGGAMPRILGMLAALQPAPALREARRRRAGVGASGAGGAAGGGSRGSGVGTAAAGGGTAAPQAADRPVVELPYTLKELSAGLPAHSAYVGYRGDLVSLMSNGAFRRPRVVSALLAGGGLELLLAQTHLDEHSPLAREWALWGVRNMCEGSEEVQGRIAGLQLQTAVETPELQKLGMKLELDKATGKLKVTKTKEAEALLDKSP